MKIPIKYKDQTILLDEEDLKPFRKKIKERDFILIPLIDNSIWTYEVVKDVSVNDGSLG
jgi:7,8-dihydro-6-hydroxymethylpterin-pyrophosphokinase